MARKVMRIQRARTSEWLERRVSAVWLEDGIIGRLRLAFVNSLLWRCGTGSGRADWGVEMFYCEALRMDCGSPRDMRSTDGKMEIYSSIYGRDESERGWD